MNDKKNLHEIILYAIVGLLLCMSVVYFAWSLMKMPVDPSGHTPNISVNNAHYENDRFVLLGKDADDPFLLELDMSRKQNESGEFLHYYSLDMLYEGELYDEYERFTSLERNVEAQKFVNSFVRTTAKDLSSRETIALELEVEDNLVMFNTGELVGDFLIKNIPDHTKYYSEGDGTIEINGKRLEVHVLYGKVYAEDYRKYVFFEGHGTIQLLARQFILWDDDGRFYVIDSTDVEVGNPAYTSHQWVLYKDVNNTTRKMFAVQVTNNNEEEAWNASIPLPINKDLSIHLKTRFKGLTQRKVTSGYGEGVVVDKQGQSLPVRGLVYTSSR